MKLIKELKRRNVFRVGLAYAIASWLIIQVLEIVLDSFGSPEWVMKTVLVVLACGLPVALIFAWAFELTPEGIKREKDVDRTQSITPQTGRKLDFTIIGILAVAVILLLMDRFTGQDPDTVGGRLAAESDGREQGSLLQDGTNTTDSNPPSSQAGEAGSGIHNAKSIAVLPFVNMSSDPEQEYFSDGIAEEILNSLAKVKDLKVAGRTSSFAFKGENQDLRRVGEALGVANILEGSVRKSGTKVRITAQLIQVNDGFHLWSESYDRELDDVFVIQDEIAQAILEQLKAHLLVSEQQAIVSARTDSKAYDLYLLAKQRTFERKEAPLQSAAALLDEAIVVDPDYAPAYAQRAVVTMLLKDDAYGQIPKQEALEQAKLYIDKAMSLDPELAEANAALGLFYTNRSGEAQMAVEPLKKALEINPNLVDAANWLSSALYSLGKMEEAMKVMESMTEIDPFYRPGIWYTVGRNNQLGKTADSWAYINRISPFFPDDPILDELKGSTYLAEGRSGDALPLFESALQREPGSTSARSGLGTAYIISGQYERGAEVPNPFIESWALALLGRHEEASTIAAKIAAGGEDVSTYFRVTNIAREYAEAVKFFETRWTDFEAFEQEFPPTGIFYFLSYADLAQAYRSVGNEQRFLQALARFRDQIDAFRKYGADDSVSYMAEAIYFNLAGDQENALNKLRIAVDKGYLGYPRLATEWPQFITLEGDPEYQAIQDLMLEHLNAERAKLKLEPMSI